MKATSSIENTSDILDSRDIIARIDYLDGTEDEEEQAELKALCDLQEEAEGYSEDWRYGATLIRDSYFEDYARELAEDISAIPSDNKWPCTCIDWKEAAEELQQDYTSVEFDGVTYWVR